MPESLNLNWSACIIFKKTKLDKFAILSQISKKMKLCRSFVNSVICVTELKSIHSTLDYYPFHSKKDSKTNLPIH
jgi:hypothetical protein